MFTYLKHFFTSHHKMVKHLEAKQKEIRQLNKRVAELEAEARHTKEQIITARDALRAAFPNMLWY